uniref:Methionine--tRNA ligase, mitochondrial n=1 Tax=Acrobeloides nanus TaxID=290746 RepID=A0A914E937_9BILA
MQKVKDEAGIRTQTTRVKGESATECATLESLILNSTQISFDCFLSDFTQLKAVQVINADLVNNLGNLLSRTTVAKINPKQKYPDAFDLNSLDPELRIVCDHLTKNLKTLPEKVGKLYDSLLFYKALELIAETSNLANVFFQHSNAWKKDPSINLSTTLFLTYESIRLCALLIQPIVPSYADRILSRLGISKNERDLNTAIFGGESTIKLYGRDLGKDNGVVMERIKLENLDPSIVIMENK